MGLILIVNNVLLTVNLVKKPLINVCNAMMDIFKIFMIFKNVINVFILAKIV